MAKKLILRFREVTIGDIGLVGGKNASLGEMIKKLGNKMNIPDGFATTSFFYWQFIKKSGLLKKMKEVLKDLDTKNIKNLQDRGKKIRALILKAQFQFCILVLFSSRRALR